MTYCGVNIKTLSRDGWGPIDIQNIKTTNKIDIKDAEEQEIVLFII